VTNLETLIVYAGLIGALFFVGLFLQQTAGYSPIQAGLATTPISLILFVLSPRFGRIATGIGPRVPMSAGPIVGGIGLLLLTRVGANADYVKDVLPGMLVFGLGLSATVAPLTATALNSVEERHAGVASGINNGVSRVAGLLAIAILGALIAGQFQSTVDDRLAGTELSAKGQRAVDEARNKPLGAPDTAGLPANESDQIGDAVIAANVKGFHLGIGVGGVLMIIGGVVAGLFLRNPDRRTDQLSPRAATAGECARCRDDGHDRGHAEHDAPEPVSA
jgi:hypothetical protein